MESVSVQEAIIPGLTKDLAMRCLAKLSHGYHGVLESVSKTWKDLVRGREYGNYKANEGWCGYWLFVVTESSDNQWVAYDPEADRWHPLPNNPHGSLHFGFSCVCVRNRFLVIGGTRAATPGDTDFPSVMLVTTNDVLQFDPFRKEWSRVTSMRTPRSYFACCVISGKVYVAGGKNSSNPKGLSLAEVYDPRTDRWEELPAMPEPLVNCKGISYEGKFHVLSDNVGLEGKNPSQIFDPSNKKWSTVEDTWPLTRAMNLSVQVMGYDEVYTLVYWGEQCFIKTRDSIEGEWYNVGAVPPVHLPGHPQEVEGSFCGLAALRRELYVLGGRALEQENFIIVRLDRVRVCDPSQRPLNWREIRPMCRPAAGTIKACASLEEECSLLDHEKLKSDFLNDILN